VPLRLRHSPSVPPNSGVIIPCLGGSAHWNVFPKYFEIWKIFSHLWALNVKSTMSMGEPVIIKELGLEREWANATYNSPFIKALASDTLACDKFDVWLVQVRSSELCET
jgi:hypothetical protein